jgi:hypothetical protein
MFDERGVPKDVCKEIRDQIERYVSDGHSHSWLTAAEFKQALYACGYYIEYPESGFCKMIQYVEDWLEQEAVEAMLLSHDIQPEARIVFFFDN